MRDTLSDRGGGVGGHRVDEQVRQGWDEPAVALTGFVEVAGEEVSGYQQGQDVSFDVGADGFEQVQSEAVAVLLVCVDDAHAGVETDSEGGAGGASVWDDLRLSEALAGTPYEFDPLPDGIHFTMAIRRAIRSGRSNGFPIEDLGIRGIPYAMTRRDLLDGNRDLYGFCAQTLHDLSRS